MCSGEIEPVTDVRIELSRRITMAQLFTKISSVIEQQRSDTAVGVTCGAELAVAGR